MAFAKRKTLRDGTTRWYASYRGGDGRQHMEGGFSSEREARKLAHRREEEARRGEWVDPASAKMTFARYVADYYWPIAQSLEVTTRAAYAAYIAKHFLPAFGEMPMRRISATIIQSWVNNAGSTLSATSVTKYHALLHRIFARAVIDRVVPVNPCAHTVLPKITTKRRQVLAPTEFNSLLACLDVRYRTMVHLVIETGLRWGELVALRPCDIDLERREILVHRTLIEVSRKDSPTGERITVKPYPKDDESRVVQIEPTTCALIRSHMVLRGVRDEDLLFTTSVGTPISRNSFRTKIWLPALRSAGLDRNVTFHALRAAHASWLLAGGADLQVVKDRLGHRQISTTEKYLGALPDSGDRALAALRRTRQGLA